MAAALEPASPAVPTAAADKQPERVPLLTDVAGSAHPSRTRVRATKVINAKRSTRHGGASEKILVGMMALLTAGILFLAWIFKLGFLADFLSRTVLVGRLRLSAAYSNQFHDRAKRTSLTSCSFCLLE